MNRNYHVQYHVNINLLSFKTNRNYSQYRHAYRRTPIGLRILPMDAVVAEEAVFGSVGRIL